MTRSAAQCALRRKPMGHLKRAATSAPPASHPGRAANRRPRPGPEPVAYNCSVNAVLLSVSYATIPRFISKTGLRFGLPDHLTTTGQASGQANYYMVKQVAKTTSWSGVGGQASGPANFRRGLAKNFACGARNPGGRPPDPARSSNPTQPQIEALIFEHHFREHTKINSCSTRVLI